LDGEGTIDIYHANEDTREGSVVWQKPSPIDIDVNAIARHEIFRLGPLLVEVGNELL